MAGYFDTRGYAPQKSPLDFTEGLSSLGDALTDVLNRRQKAQQFQDQLQFQQQDAQRKFQQNAANDAYQNRIIDQRAKQQALEFNQRQEEMKRKAAIDASAALGRNNPELAKTILHGTVTYDPQTGAENGRGELAPGPMKDLGPEPQPPAPLQDPEGLQFSAVPPEIAARRRGLANTPDQQPSTDAASPPPETPYQRPRNFIPSGVEDTIDAHTPPGQPGPQRPANFIPSGVVATSDDRPPNPALLSARTFDPQTEGTQYTAEQVRADQQQLAQQKTAFDAASAAYPGARAAYDASRTQAERERPYTIRFGANDPGTQVTAEAQRYAGRDAAVDDFVNSLRGITLSPRDQQAAAASVAAIKAGEDPQKVYKQFNDHMVLGERFGDETQLQTQKDAAALERAKIAGPRNPGDFHIGQLHETQENGTVRDMKAWQDDFKDFERQAAGIPLQAKSYARLATAVKNINSGNSELQRDAQSTLVSAFSGGGVVRKFEQEFLLSHLAGLGASGQTALQHIQNGKMGDEDLAVSIEATRRAMQEHQDRAEELYQGIQRGFGPGTGHDYFGGNIDAKTAMTLKGLGFDAPPMYPGVDPVQLGDIVRPYRSQLGRGQSPPPAAPPPTRPAGAPPEIKARDKSKKNKSVDDALGALGG